MELRDFAKLPESARENIILEYIIKKIPIKNRSRIQPDLLTVLKFYLHGLSNSEIMKLDIHVGTNKYNDDIAIMCKLNENDDSEKIIIRGDGAIYPYKYSLSEFTNRLSLGRNYKNGNECIDDYLRNLNSSLYPS